MESYCTYALVTCFFHLLLVFKDSYTMMLVAAFHSFSPLFSTSLYKYTTLNLFTLWPIGIYFLVFLTVMNNTAINNSSTYLLVPKSFSV